MESASRAPAAERIPEPYSRTLDLGIPVHYLEWEGAGEATFVLVHGLGGSALNWLSAAPLLTPRGRVLAPDLAGHGRTARESRASSIEANRELLDAFLEEAGGGPVVLSGNSMGGAIAMMEAAAAPHRVAALVLVDPALPVWPDAADPLVMQTFAAYATPGLGEEFLRVFRESIGPEGMVDYVFQMCCVDSDRIPREVVRRHVEQLKEHGLSEESEAGFLEAARTLLELLQNPDRVREAIAAVRAPTLLMTGESDRLVPVESARAVADLRPDWRLEVLPNLGHIPMLEDPERFASLVGEWLDELGLAPAAS
jgi:pimeloyl-ACP methyl ester carboxylesterase